MSAAAEPAEAVRALREEIERIWPAPRRGTPAGDAIAWAFANALALSDTAFFARAMVAMGLRRIAVLPHGDIRWWQPEYCRAGMHWSRGTAADINRFLRDSRVFVMHPTDPAVVPPPDLLLLVNRDTGAWRTASGGAFGDDIISLGAFCWRCTTGKAAARIARACGYRNLPRVGDLARA